ncbi:MAG: sodium/substrate symporter small subunit [Pseudomonadota bacterium]
MPKLEREERKPYWRYTKLQVVISLLPFLLLVFVLPIYAENMNDEKFLGFPLGYFMVGHGLWIIAIFTIATHINRQDEIDHWHGANEDS